MHSLAKPSPQDSRTLGRIAEASLFLAAGASAALWFVRAFCAISLVTPYRLITTGCEEESNFSIWKFVHGQAVYADPHRVPFAASYFNWGYYWFYGIIARFSVSLLHLDDIWIPTAGRIVTALCTLTTGLILYFALRGWVRTGLFAQRRVAWVWCLLAAFSPLIGFSAISMRPDVAALMFECLGLCALLAYLRKERLSFIVLAAVLFYGGWAFKQSFVTMLAGSAIALLLLNRWRAFFLLSGVWWALVAATLIARGPVYRECILFSQAHLPLHPSLGLENAIVSLRREPLLLVCIAAVFFPFSKKPDRSRQTPA